jgi:hypothetical protein
VRRKAVIPLLLAASAVLWAAGPSGTMGFLLRSPIILINDLISVVRQALIPQTVTSAGLPISTSALALSLGVPGPSTTSAPSNPPPGSTPTPPPAAPVPPPDEILAPVQEVLSPAEPVLEPVQNAVEPAVNPVEQTLEPVNEAVGGSGGGNSPDVGGAAQDAKSAVERLDLP